MTAAVKCWAVVPAAGIGERFGASIPKQYVPLHDKTVFEYALEALSHCPRIEGITIAIHANDQHFTSLALPAKPVWIVAGGESRAHSVLNALHDLQSRACKNDFVLVHDAARPCLTEADLNKLLDETLSHAVGGILAAPVSDTLKKVQKSMIVDTVNREQLWRALTPQMFRYGLLFDALSHAVANGIAVTDEAQAIELQGMQPCIVEGDTRNIKVTTKNDLHVAELFIKSVK
jgi:2-C-methyl-D-erythritol 4-phosphate cytidylyltransferase